MGSRQRGLPDQGNKPLAEAMAGKRRSNAAGPHDPRPNRERTRATAKTVAIRDAGGGRFGFCWSVRTSS